MMIPLPGTAVRRREVFGERAKEGQITKKQTALPLKEVRLIQQRQIVIESTRCDE
jgi:hypothetical protein